MIAVFVAVAVLLVAFGGLLAAADAALGVLEPHRPRRPGRAPSREAVAAGDRRRHRRARQRPQLHARRLGDDRRRAGHARVRVGSFEQWWLVAAAARAHHDRRPRSCWSARARAASGARTPAASSRSRRRVVRAIRVCSARSPTRWSRSATGSRPAARRRATFSSEEQLLEHGRRGDRARRARGGRPRAHPLDLRVGRHGRARGDGPAHRHDHHRRRRHDRRGDGRVPQHRASRACRWSARTPTRSSASSTCATSRALSHEQPLDAAHRPSCGAGAARRCSCPSRRRPTTPCGRCSSSRTTSRWWWTSTAGSPAWSRSRT